MCCTPLAGCINNYKRHASVCATRLSVWRGAARRHARRKAKLRPLWRFADLWSTASTWQLSSSLYDVNCDGHFKFHARAPMGALRATRISIMSSLPDRCERSSPRPPAPNVHRMAVRRDIEVKAKGGVPTRRGGADPAPAPLKTRTAIGMHTNAKRQTLHELLHE